MSKGGVKRVAALAIGIPAAVVLLGCGGVLIAGYLDGVRQAPIDKQRIETLEAQVKEDGTQLEELKAELDGQTKASLERSRQQDVLGRVAIAAAVLFLICGKWLVSLNGQRPPALSKIAEVRGVLAEGMKARAEQALQHAMPQHEAVADAKQIALVAVDAIITERGKGQEAAIPILLGIQSHYRYLPEPALRRVCELTDITPAQITEVSTFYSQFRRTPIGEHVIKVCHGTACHVAGARRITDEIRSELKIPDGGDTDPHGLFTVEEVACLGCCTLAPAAQIDGVTYGHLTPDRVPELLSACLESNGNGAVRRSSGVVEAGAAVGEIRVGLGSCCMAKGSGRVRDALERAIAETGVQAKVKRVGCVGMCHHTPMIEAVVPGGSSALYAQVAPEDARSFVRQHFRAAGAGKRIGNAISQAWESVRVDREERPTARCAIAAGDGPVTAFLGRQKHIATEQCGRLDPTDLDEYLQFDGFKALERCVRDCDSANVIDEIRESGLRGRGGGGFPTGEKWAKVRSADGRKKYVICNGDEGDPGAFMDRMLMESFPYRIIEGLAIAAYAIGADEGYFYIRAEYPLAVRRIREAIEQCERRGFLGDDVFGSGFGLRLRVMEGAGAFVCGEETALLASIQGERGMPRLRPPYPADGGLWGLPTLVNNVETYAVVPWILRNGAAGFAELGTPTSKGTKVFSLAGKVDRVGLIEVPMGMTIRQIVEEIGGGVAGGRRFKAVQVGGPSGGCVPAELADTPVDYEALTEVGAMMGSGGLVVLDETDCMVDIARYFLSFTQNQSCGKCTYCRVGTRRMLDILDRLCEGHGRKSDIDELEELAREVKAGSLCGLGTTAPNPVLSTIRYFRDEYEAHVEKRCPAGRCKALITYSVTDECTGCTLCAQHCPADAIAYVPYEKHEIDSDKCTRCDICRIKCPEDAIKVV